MDSARTLFLLDAMALAYRAYFAFVSRPRINSRGLHTSCVYGFTTTLVKLVQGHGLTHGAVVFDGPEKTFRSELYADYKAHRLPPPEDLISNLPLIKDVARSLSLPVLQVEGVEADDVIGALARLVEAEGHRAIIVSPDKDFQQLLSMRVSMLKPGSRGQGFSPVTEASFRAQYELEPRQFIDVLALMGDKADNVPGVYGIGEKNATRLIQQYGSVEELLAHAEEVKGKRAREGLLAQGDMARLSRRLVTIKTDVPVRLDWDEMQRGKLTGEKTRSLFKRLEFISLLDRLGREPDAGAPVPVESGEAPRQEYNPSLADFRIISQLKELKALERATRTMPTIALHAVRTEGAPVWSDLVGVAVAWAPDAACYIPVPLPDGSVRNDIVRVLAPVLTNMNLAKIGHDLKPLCVLLRFDGVDVRGALFDTQVAHYLLAPEQVHNLDFVARERLNYSSLDWREIVGKGREARPLRDIPPAELVAPACEAAALAFRLEDVLRRDLEAQGLSRIATAMEFPLIEALAHMEEVGVIIDLDRLLVIESQLKKEAAELEEKIFAEAGEVFLIGSPQQVGEILFERLGLPVRVKTPSGIPSTREDVLMELATSHPLPGLIIDWRKVTRLQGTYIEGLRRMAHPKTGRVHTVFNQTVVATGRLSSSDPGLQNIPSRSATGRELRRAFVAPRGWCLLSADYSQIELRILAHMSGDAGLAEIFTSGRDPHTETAARINGVEAADVTREQRESAKAVNYGIPYGLSATGLAQQLRCSREDAEALMRVHRESFPGVGPFLHEQVEEARRRGYAETLWGRRRYLPNITSSNRLVRSAAERIAINMPIQGTQADMIKLAAVDIQGRLRHEGLRTRPILQVHDELIFEAPHYELKVARDLIQDAMTGALPLSIPIEVNINHGPTWLDAH